MKNLGIFSFLSLVCVSTCCSDGWFSHGSKCYHFSREKEPWIGAYDICKVLNGQLLEIQDAEENAFIQRQAVTHGSKSYWIALSDLEEEGTWVWMNSKEHLSADSFTDWYPGQPSSGGATGEEDCAQIYTGLHLKWNDASCKDSYYYIIVGTRLLADSSTESVHSIVCSK